MAATAQWNSGPNVQVVGGAPEPPRSAARSEDTGAFLRDMAASLSDVAMSSGRSVEGEFEQDWGDFRIRYRVRVGD